MSTAHPLDRVWPFFAPLSRALAQLRVGFVRQQLKQAGVQQREVEIHGARLSYVYQAGEAAHAEAPMVLIHGLGDRATTWGEMFAQFSQRRVYALDLPGYGFSSLPKGQTFATIEQMRDMLAVFIREVVGMPALVVGNSMGGWLTVELGLTNPELASGLVLLNPGGALLGGEASYTEFRDLLGASDLVSSRLVLRRLYGMAPRLLLYLSQSAIQDVFQRPVVSDFMNQVEEREFLQAEDVRKLNVPTMLIWGESDQFLPEGSFEFFRDNLREAEVHVLPKVGHIPQVESPREVARLIEQFSAKVSSARIQESGARKPGAHSPTARS